MHVEIKELLIKAVVIGPQEEKTARPMNFRELERLKKEIISECVAEVMDKIQDLKER